MKIINKYGIVLRAVEVNDAEFILSLRTDSTLNQFISYTNPNLEDQIKWIENYKIREKSGLEYYFTAEDTEGNKFGTIRIYDFDERSFEIGSWLFRTNSPLGMAVKAHFIGFETGFELLKADYCRFEIRKKNVGVLRYMNDFKTTKVGEDDLNYYFTLSKENFYARRNKISVFLNSGSTSKKVHHTAEVQSTNIGEGTQIWQYCVILKDAIIGKNCNLNYNVFIENDVIIGNNVTIKSGVQLWDGLRIGDNVFISPNVTFTNDPTPRSKHYPKDFLTTNINEGASIGANSSIIGGITIGKYAMIGAGSVVTKNIPDYTLWYGNPAVFKAYICQCGKKLNDQLECIFCRKTYKLKNGAIQEK
jgi:acetyltransferase-like isoleucine patch superfamily enzyme